MLPPVSGRWVRMVQLLGLALASSLLSSKTPPSRGAEIQTVATDLVQRQDEATMRGDLHALHQVLLPNSKISEQVGKKAMQRSAYMQDWARARKIQFDSVTVHVRIDRLRWVSPDEVKVAAADQARYGYHHLTGNESRVWFGLGVMHRYVFAEDKGRWYIKDDTFIDPLNQDTRLKGAAVPAVIQVKPESRTERPPNVGAARALEYAKTYCGAAPGCGHNNRYNPHYADFNWNGGDCSNFISQVLRAGGFTETSQWSWNTEDDGTAAWVNATRLAQYLRRSGRVTLYASGTLPEILKPGPAGQTALDQLRPGDLIGYFETGRVVHFAVVAGFDPDGYPVVMSHSADRYREPWDLGWDRTTRFLLYQVHYPAQPVKAEPNW